MPTEYSTVRVPDVEPRPSEGSGTMHVNLGDELGCEKLAARVWSLSPGDAMNYHRQAEQEELYYVLDGPGRMKLDGTVRTIDEGTAVRVSPETPRQLLNDTENEEHSWLVVGAPATEDDGRPIDEDGEEPG